METNQEIKENGHQEQTVQLLFKEEEDFARDLASSEILEPSKKEKKPKSSFSEDFQKWEASMQIEKPAEERIRECIHLMRTRLSLGGTPKFREFWEVRKVCLPLFKEDLSPKARAELWQEYVDLSIEARRLKTILDEQSSFACEQIELAIRAIEEDLSHYEERLLQIPSLDLVLQLSPFKERKEEYNQAQKELHFLNALAAKINSLRKEAIKTEMRVRSKNKIFDQLSVCGDKVFPRRKEWIKKISQDFSEHIATFLKTYFDPAKKGSTAFHILREEVKTLQLLAKLLTLNTHSFNETRVALSSCWDLLKTWDKERKKEIAEKKVHQKQSYDEAASKLVEFQKFCAEETSIEAVLAKYQEMLGVLKGLKDLSLGELRQWKEQFAVCKRPFEERQQEERKALELQEKEFELARLQKIKKMREEIQTALEATGQMSSEELEIRKSVLAQSLQGLSASKTEKMELERLFKQFKDHLLDVKRKNILSFSSSAQEKYLELQAIVAEKKQRRQEIKLEIESYRKALGGSGFDFEKAMMYREMMEAEKNLLEKVEAAIEELEEEIEQIKDGA